MTTTDFIPIRRLIGLRTGIGTFLHTNHMDFNSVIRWNFGVTDCGAEESVKSVDPCETLRRVLHKIGCTSAIEASFIALGLRNLCIRLAASQQ